MSAKSIHVLTLGITPIERQLPPGQPDLWTLAACDRQQQRLRDTASLAREVVLAVRSRTRFHGQCSPPCACGGSGSVTGTRRPQPPPRRAGVVPRIGDPAHRRGIGVRQRNRTISERPIEMSQRRAASVVACCSQLAPERWPHGVRRPPFACRGGRSSRAGRRWRRTNVDCAADAPRPGREVTVTMPSRVPPGQRRPCGAQGHRRRL